MSSAPPSTQTAAPADGRPVQRVGHIGADDNRFCGAAVFGAPGADLASRCASPLELLAHAFAMPPLDADGRSALFLLSLCLTSPDARVWPLKLTRVLSSYGNSLAGYFGAQLAAFTERIGPGAGSSGAASLRWLMVRLPGEPEELSRAQVSAAIAEHLASRGRIPGFGVPFRAEDERLLALHRLLSGHSATRGRAWRLHLRVAEALRATDRLEPNILFSAVALLTDLGLSAERTGLFMCLLMNHTFAAHAAEAAEQDAPFLRALAPAHLDDRTPLPRRSPRALR